MRVLVIGAGRTGAHVIEQLQKNPAITVVTADPGEDRYAVEQGIIDAVDIREELTPLSLEDVLAKAGADLVILAMPVEDMNLGEAPGVDILAASLREEIAALSRLPVIEVARVTK